MPRLRQLPLTNLAGAGLLMAALAVAAGTAQSQSPANNDPVLMRPVLDGDPRNPPRFRRPGAANKAGPTGIGPIPDYSYHPAAGAGSTGFNSTNVRRRALKKTDKPKSGTASKPPAGPTPQAAPPAPPPTVSASAARLPQNRERRGAPPATALASAIGATPVTVPPPRRLPALEDNPFSPTGIAAGAFLLRPAIELTGGYDTNPTRTTGGRGSLYYVVAPELLANSNWTRHELTANLRGSYTGYDTASQINRPSVDAKLNGRVDVTALSRIDLETRFVVGTESPGSPNVQAGLAKLPIYTMLGGTAGFTQRFNRFEVTASGGADRKVYQDSTFTDGTTGSNEDRNYNIYATQFLTGYEVMPGLKPYVEIRFDSRVHDLAFDRAGFRRDSEGWAAKVGTTFQYSAKLTGDMAVGYLMRSYKDPALPDISGMTVDGSLTWLASALTTLKLTARTIVDESVLPGVSGVFTHDLGLEVDHAFRRWLVGVVKLTRAHDAYDGLPRQDDRYSASAALTYMLSREMQLKGEIRRDWRTSNQPGNGYSANVFLLGLRLQR